MTGYANNHFCLSKRKTDDSRRKYQANAKKITFPVTMRKAINNALLHPVTFFARLFSVCEKTRIYSSPILVFINLGFYHSHVHTKVIFNFASNYHLLAKFEVCSLNYRPSFFPCKILMTGNV